MVMLSDCGDEVSVIEEAVAATVTSSARHFLSNSATADRSLTFTSCFCVALPLLGLHASQSLISIVHTTTLA